MTLRLPVTERNIHMTITPFCWLLESSAAPRELL